MKRTAASILLLAGIGGCVSPDGGKTAGGLKVKGFNQTYQGQPVPGVVGPTGEPVMATPEAVEATKQMAKKAKDDKKSATAKKTDAKKLDPAVVQASATVPAADAGVQQAGGFARVKGSDCGDNCGGHAHLPGLGGFGHRLHDGGGHGGGDPYAYGPSGTALGTLLGRNGIMPVPGMGPPGAVAAVGAIGPGSAYGPVATNMRTSIKFVNPANMKVTWLGQNGYIEPGLTTPAPYNFLQGNVYRLKLTGVPRQGGRTYYPTLEVSPATYKTLTFLSHNTVPVGFTDDDFERVNAGSMVVKVIYLPDPAFQDAAAVAGAEELVSTQLAPGVDPIVEATSRGTILAVIRLGNIDLENPFSPRMDAVPGMSGPGMPAPPAGAMPAPGMMMPPPGMMPAPGLMPAPGGGVMPPPGGAMMPVPTVPRMPAALPPVKGTTTSNPK